VANLTAVVAKVNTGGPYTYTIFRDGLGEKVVTGINSVAAAFNGARDDLSALIPAGEEVERVSITASTGPI